MRTIKSYTDLEQSKKLAEFLPLEGADMSYDAITEGMREKMIIKDWQANIGLDIAIRENRFSYRNGYVFPAWSLSALLGVLPYPYIEQNYKGKWTCRVEHGNTTYLWEASNPVDACVAMIERLHKLNLL